MSRQLTLAALAAVQAEVVSRTIAVELDFPSGFVRYSGCPYDLTINGATFTGIGMLGGVSAAEEGSDLRAYGLVVTVSGIPRDVVSVALAEAYQGRRATVWEVLLGADGQPVADPIIIFRGRMDQMDVLLGDEARISVKLENRLADWERPRVRRYTDEDQRSEHPGDLFFQFVSATTEKELVWPNRTFFQNR